MGQDTAHAQVWRGHRPSTCRSIRAVMIPCRSTLIVMGTCSPTMARTRSSSHPSGSASSLVAIAPCIEK
jgi:hypothetical protein